MKLEDVDSLKGRVQKLADELMAIIDELAEADVMGLDKPPKPPRPSAGRWVAKVVRRTGPRTLEDLAYLTNMNKKLLKKKLDDGVEVGTIALEDGVYSFVKEKASD